MITIMILLCVLGTAFSEVACASSEQITKCCWTPLWLGCSVLFWVSAVAIAWNR